MKIKTTVLRQIVRVSFPARIDYNRLAEKVGVEPQTAWNWIKTGNVPDRYIPLIKGIPLELVRKD